MKYTDFGISVKNRLLEIGKTQEWLSKQISKETGLYFDSSYMYRIITGRSRNQKIVNAICEILGMEENN